MMDLRRTRYLLELEEGEILVIFKNPCTISKAIEKIKEATGIKLFDLSPLGIDESIELSKSLITLRIK